MASSIKVSDLTDYLEKHIAENPQLLTKALISTAPDYFTVLTDVVDEIPLVELAVGSILQPGNKDTFDPIDDAVAFKNRIGKVRDCKVDLQIKPTQVTAMQKSWLAKMARMSTPTSPYQIPFEAEITSQVMAKLQEDIRLLALYKGAYNAAGTTPATVFDGLLTKIAAEIVSTAIPAANVFTGAAITAANAIAQFEGVADKVSNQYSMSPLVCIAAPENVKFYNRNYRTTYGTLNYNNEFDKQVIDGTNIEIVAEPGMAGSDRVIITPKSNLFWLIDSESRQSGMTVEYALRNINWMVDFRSAPEYGISEIIWTNDQA